MCVQDWPRHPRGKAQDPSYQVSTQKIFLDAYLVYRKTRTRGLMHHADALIIGVCDVIGGFVYRNSLRRVEFSGLGWSSIAGEPFIAGPRNSGDDLC